MRIFCVISDSNYIKFLNTLIQSMEERIPFEFKLVVLGLDNNVENYLIENSLNLDLINLSYLEEKQKELLIAKKSRSKVEYFYTLSSGISNYCMINYTYDSITYLDSDLFFFNNPEKIFSEIKGYNVAIIPHNFTDKTKKNIKYGIYNVGWVTFNNTNEGRRCLVDWYNNCLDWCYQKLENGKYADQKYLDSWPNEYERVKILKNKGLNLAIWNIGNYKISKKDGEIYVDNDKLIFFHFAGLQIISNNYIITGLSKAKVFLEGVIKFDIYSHYLKILISTKGKTLPSPKKNIHRSFLVNIIMKSYYYLLTIIYKDKIKINELNN